MNRREVLKKIALGMGGILSATTMGVLFESFTLLESKKNGVLFTTTDEAILAEFAEVILPTTKLSPGAKEAGLGKFIPMIVADCYPPNMQTIFSDGLKEMQNRAVKEYHNDFLKITPQQRKELLDSLRIEALQNKKAPSFFKIARDLTILGYFSSEIGCTKAREYLPVPGYYDGNVTYKKGQKAWTLN